jgi:hypothetical protein
MASLKRFNSYVIFWKKKRKRWHFNTGDYLTDVTTLAGLTVLDLKKRVSTVNKGNNKITELRTILQRESQNS